MASTMLTGDRRWTPTRKLTVLGKVPKPINLPSQRLENHGVDPNVEIVPKGTLTWGSRPSTAVPNAWGTSSGSSPHTDGTAGSPSHRPSSGGGTQPSTDGSARSHESVSNAWGPNSRPSSASGVLTSSQISVAATRPRSADTRHGSSHLTRFADNLIDNTTASGTAGASEKLGTSSSKNSGFTLSSGDFPSLCSDKNSDTHSQRGHSSQGRPQSSQGRPQSSQGRPPSACGADSRPTEFFEHSVNRNTDHFDHVTVNTWKADNHQHAGHGTSPNIDNLHRDPHYAPSYPQMNMPLLHYDSWHNPPFRPADGAWYRGGAPGGPYMQLGHPGNYPIDYPHVPARPLSNPQQFPRHDAGHGGFSHNNCEPCRPYMPTERYMGTRPGAYPGPVPYAGYYGPHHRPEFHNSSERHTSIMGMSRPVVHNQYATQHQSCESANFHARSGEYGVMNREQMEPHQANETRGPYRVLLKHHEGSEDLNETEKMDHSVVAGTPHLEKGKHAGVSSHNGDAGTKSQTQQTVVSPTLPVDAVSSWHTDGVDAKSTDTVVRNSLTDPPKVVDNGLMMRPEAANIQSRGLQQYHVIKKNAYLMEKVESLNNKARIADFHGAGGPNSSREKPIGIKDVTAGADEYTNVASSNDSSVNNATYMLNMGTTMPQESNTLAEDKNQEATSDGKVTSFPLNSLGAGENAHFLGQKKVQAAENVDYHAKSGSNRHYNIEGIKKQPRSESSTNTSMTSSKGKTVETDASHAAFEKQQVLHAASSRDASQTVSSVDQVDQKAQRAKMREIRAKQLQQEEEERIREQKAKALAKLEELNRRTLAENSNPKLPLQNSVGLNNMTESGPNATPTDNTASLEDSGATVACNSEAMKQVDDCGIKNLGHSAVLSSTGTAQASHSDTQSSDVPHAQSPSMEQESSIPTKIMPETTSDIHHNTTGKQKQLGYRKKHCNLQENSIGGKQKNSTGTRSPTEDPPRSDILPNVEDPPVQHKKRNNRSTRHNNANNLAEGLTSSTSPSQPHTAVSSENPHTASGKIEPSTLVERAVLVPCESSMENVGTMSSSEVQVMQVKHGLLESTEDDHGRGSNHWKPHTQRKITRNQQPNKLASKYHANDAVMWAPVKIPCKNETADEVSKNSVIEPAKPNDKSGNDMHNGLKAKRAEMERYVPKPVAKELSQQVNSQQASPSLSQSASRDTNVKFDTGLPSAGGGGHDGLSVGKAAAASDTGNGENTKHNKNGRVNALWLRRGSAESPPVEGYGSSDHAKTVQMASDKLQTPNIVVLPEVKVTHTDDGWNDNSNAILPGESIATAAVGESYGASSQRRQTYEVHRISRSMGSQRGTTDRTEHPSPALGHIGSEGRHHARNGSQGAGVESTKPHWQPKSQTYSHGRQGNRGNRGAQRTVSPGLENAPAMNADTVTSDLRTTESRRGRMVTADSAKEQTTGKPTPPDDGHQCVQPVQMGGNQRGQHHGRLQRGYDPSYGGPDFGKETKMQNYGDERSRGNQQVEYQRVGSHDKTKERFQQNPNADKGAHQSSWAPGSGYGERGGRRFPRGGRGGQFYGWSDGAPAHVGESYNGGE